MQVANPIFNVLCRAGRVEAKLFWSGPSAPCHCVLRNIVVPKIISHAVNQLSDVHSFIAGPIIMPTQAINIGQASLA